MLQVGVAVDARLTDHIAISDEITLVITSREVNDISYAHVLYRPT
jgi:hypothetical protein